VLLKAKASLTVSRKTPAMLGKRLVLTAVVSGPKGKPTPTHSVSFENGAAAKLLCKGIKLSKRKAACKTTTTNLGVGRTPSWPPTRVARRTRPQPSR